MQGINIAFEVDAQQMKAFNRVLQNRWKRADNLRKPLRESSNYLLDQIDQNFSLGGAIWGKWKRRKRSYPHPILRKTNTMKKGFTARVGSREATITNLVEYFKYHQLGTRRLPARKMWGINSEQAREITKRFQQYLIKESNQ